MKKSIRKIVCLIMAFCLLPGILSISISAEEKASDPEVFEALEFLQLLKIIPENYYDYNTKMDEEVSRADYVDAVAKIIGSYNYEGSLYYYDVPKTHYAYGSIAKLTEMKVVNGVGDGLFRPDDAISGMSAYKIILSLMGYNAIAEVDGGYPAGYIKIAKDLDIYDSELASGNLSRGGMIKLLYRAMKVNIFDAVSYSDQGFVEYEVSEDETLLSVYHNIFWGEGVVTAADMITLSGEIPGDNKQIGIDGVIYNSNSRLNEMLGEEVEYFVLDDKSEARGTVLFAKPTGRSEVINIQADNISKFDKNTYTLSYYKTEESSTVSKAKLARGITVIYNGVVVDKKIDEIFNSSDYSVKLIKNNDGYDTAIVKQYENYIVGMIDSSSKAIFDMVKPEKNLKLNEKDYDYMSIRDLSGNEISFADISTGNVISAFVSKDGKYIEAIVSNRQRTGELTNSKKSGDYLNLTVGGEMFEIKDNVKTESYMVGDNVTLYLDYMNKVAYLTATSENFFAAYAADGVLVEDVFDKEYKIKLFRQDGKLELYNFSDSVKVDGNTVKDAGIIAKAFEYNGAFKPQLALFEVNSKGEIISVDTVEFNDLKESRTNSLQKNMNVEKRAWRSGVGAFGIDGAINASTVIFGIPDDDNTDTDEYEIMEMRNLVESFSYKVESYNTTDRNGYEKYVVIFKNSDMAKEDATLPIVVTNTGQAMNEDGDIVEFISGYRGNTEVSLMSDGEVTFDGLKEGMVVRTFINNKGEVFGTEIKFDPENRTYDTEEAGWNDIFATRKGFVNDIVDDVMKIGWNSGSQIDQVLPRYGSPVVICDTKDGKIEIYPGGFSDAVTYYNAKENCSSVVAITQHNRARMFVIYN